MTTARRTLKALATLLPLGALGISSALAAVPAKPVVAVESSESADPGVAQRLSAIRNAVSEVTEKLLAAVEPKFTALTELALVPP